MNGYELSRYWFDWSFENPEKINPTHSAIYFFAIEHCNRLGWKKKFGFPTQMAMDALGIKKHQTYIRYFNDLCDWGFFTLIEKSKNQYSSNIISLLNAMPKNSKALDKAIINHTAKQIESNGQSNGSINKPLTNNNITNKQSFDLFWDLYNKKVDKTKTEKAFLKISQEEIESVLNSVIVYVKNTPDVKFRKNPLTWLNGKCWNDEIISSNEIFKCEFKNHLGKIYKKMTEAEIVEFTKSGVFNLCSKEKL